MRKGPAKNVVDTTLVAQHWFWYPGEQMEGINVRTLGWHYKRVSSQQ